MLGNRRITSAAKEVLGRSKRVIRVAKKVTILKCNKLFCYVCICLTISFFYAASNFVMHRSSLAIFKRYMSQVCLLDRVVARIRQTPFGHFLDSLYVGVDAYILENIVSLWETGNMFRFND